MTRIDVELTKQDLNHDFYFYIDREEMEEIEFFSLGVENINESSCYPENCSITLRGFTRNDLELLMREVRRVLER